MLIYLYVHSIQLKTIIMVLYYIHKQLLCTHNIIYHTLKLTTDCSIRSGMTFNQSLVTFSVPVVRPYVKYGVVYYLCNQPTCI